MDIQSRDDITSIVHDFYQKAIAQEGWRKYKNIDLRFKGQVIAEKR